MEPRSAPPRTTTACSTTSRSRHSRCSSAIPRSRDRPSARAGRDRIASQIDADGKQQRELDRTRPLHYSLFNLDAFTMLAEMGRHVGVDLWHYTAPGGGSIEKAILFVAPYADSDGEVPDAGHRRAGTWRIPAAAAPSRGATRRIRHSRARSSTCLLEIRVKDPDAVNFPLEAVSQARTRSRRRISCVAQRRRSIRRMDIHAPRTPDGNLEQRDGDGVDQRIFWRHALVDVPGDRRRRVAHARRAMDRGARSPTRTSRTRTTSAS